MLEDGERLRNLSWRLYSRETLCPPTQRRGVRSNSDSSTASSTFSRVSADEPELSRSVESASSVECDEAAVVDSRCPNPGERHTTPADFQNLVHSIKHKQILKPSPPSNPNRRRSQQASMPESEGAPAVFSPPPVKTESSSSTVATATDSFASDAQDSETSVSSDSCSQHSVVRGFTPGTGITSYTSKTQLAPTPTPAPILKKSPASQSITPAATMAKKKAGMFMLGGSSGEDESSFRDRMSPPAAKSQRGSDGCRKQTSFRDEVLIMQSKRNDKESAISDDDSDDDSAAVESAIEDDDDDWEDDESEPKEEEKKEMKFYRVDSKANLTSRRSALTLNIEEQRHNPLAGSTPNLRRSRTSTPNGPSIPASPTEESALAMAARMQKSKPIVTTSNTQAVPVAASPRTTRRHMLAGELSESLRRNMLSERQQKNPLGITNIRRANTVADVTRLARVAETGEPTKINVEGTSATTAERRPNWNHYFDQSVGEYHQAGW